MISAEETLGQSIPPDTSHAVSVSLPTWRSNVGYEEGEDWVVSRMTTGYPRFFVHRTITQFAESIAQKYGRGFDDHAMLFPSTSTASRCVEFIKSQSIESHPRHDPYIVEFERNCLGVLKHQAKLQLSAVIYPSESRKLAKAFWQHTGEGVSSRRAEYCLHLYQEGLLVERQKHIQHKTIKGPRRYRKVEESLDNFDHDERSHTTDDTMPKQGNDGHSEITDRSRFLEERFGRNLTNDLASDAKTAIKRRIIGALIMNSSDLKGALQLPPDKSRIRNVPGLHEDHVYLFPSGMNAIFNAHRLTLKARGKLKSICFGFPYTDTLKLLEKFGPGCLFYGNGTSEDIGDLQRRLESGERFLALFCETPSNPLLRFPDLFRLRALADKYDFAMIIDETVGNFLNINVLPHADIVVSSLTKIFSGDSNVMGGCAILNPKSPHILSLIEAFEKDYEDNMWPEDAIFLERNSRDFVSRIERINVNAEAICEKLQIHPRVKNVYYPMVNESRQFYETCRTHDGRYGGLLSATFYSTTEAALFYDNLHTEKGPSLGTNFTLASPFVLLAHYTELEWAEQYGVERNLIRFSVGLEETETLLRKFDYALAVLSG